MLFVRKMPEFYMLIARKNIFPNIGGTCRTASSVSYAYGHSQEGNCTYGSLYLQGGPKNQVNVIYT